MSRNLEVVVQQAKREQIPFSPSEVRIWEGVYTVDPSNRFFVNPDTAQLAMQRFQDVMRRMADSENPGFAQTYQCMQDLENNQQLDAILQGTLIVGNRPAAAVVGTAMDEKFKLELHLNMQAILNLTGGMDLASVLTHEILGHGQVRRGFFYSLDTSIPEADRVKQVQAFFMSPRNKFKDESEAYKIQSEAVITAVGQGLNGFGDQVINDTATYCQTLKRGYDQRWDKFVTSRI